MSDWISVDDRLPEFHSDIMFYFPSMELILIGSLIKGTHKFRDVSGNSFYKSDITHWMPLPATPKALKDGE